MKRLEDKCKPLLTPMIQDRDSHYSDEEARLIAAWATKTAVVMEYTDLPTRSVPAEHRDWLMNREEPPPNTRVWLARNDRAVDAEVWHTGLLMLRLSAMGEERAEPANTYFSGLGIGRLFLLTLGTTVNELSRLGPPSILKDRLVQVWPNAVAGDWPPTRALTTQDIVRLFEGYKLSCYRRADGGSPPIAGLFEGLGASR